MKLYVVTDRRLYPGDERARCDGLLRQAVHWVRAGVDCIQLREKDLSPAQLQGLATRLVEVTHEAAPKGVRRPIILINGPAAVARSAGADGLHLPSPVEEGASLLAEVREAQQQWQSDAPILSTSCHTALDAERARLAGVSMALFAPVFEKPLWEANVAGGSPAKLLPGAGLDALRAACLVSKPLPIYALGGVTLANAEACVAAGAAGIAAIRLFAAEDWRQLVGR